MSDVGQNNRKPGEGGASPSETNVLIVEDETDVAGLYQGTLEAEGYNVDVVHTIGDAFDIVDDSYDVGLLDRRLPDGSGSEFLERIQDRGHDVRVVMVTAVVPDFDIVEMGFDLYLLKPVSKDELKTAAETLARRNQYNETLQRTASLASKRAVLEAEKPAAELEASDTYQQLTSKLADLETELNDITQELETNDYRRMFRDIGGASHSA